MGSGRLLVLLLVPVLVGCGSGAPMKPHPVAAPVIMAGEVGTLPAPTRTAAILKLVLPPKAVTVAGHYPLGSVVRFYIPFRNDGRRPLVIRSIDPS